jgi:hypothetical protein
MKIIYFIAISCALLSTPVFAHEGHSMEEGFLHTIYHIAIGCLCVLAAIKAYKWLKVTA